MESFRLPKTERLLKRADFVNLNRSGKRYYTEHFLLVVKKNGLVISRLGITVSKRVGNAVKRNRVKRLIREWFRINKRHFLHGYDIAVIAKRDASYLDIEKVSEELGKGFFGTENFV